MRCNKKNTLAALTSAAILAMPITAHAQALGARVGNLTVGGGTGSGSSTGIGVGGLTTGLTGLGSALGGIGTIGGSSLASVSVPSITTTGVVAANTGAIGATVLSSGGVLSASVAPVRASIGSGLVTLGTPGIGATVLGSGSVATVTTGGPVLANIGGGALDTTIPIITVNTGGNTGVNVNLGGGGGGSIGQIALGTDSFFSGGTNASGSITSGTMFRLNGGGGGGGSNGSASADGGAESSAQVCERVLRRPGAFQRNVVQQCRRVVAQLMRRR